MEACNYQKNSYDKFNDLSSNSFELEVSGLDAINNSIENIIIIPKYDIVGKPSLFGGLDKYLFELIDDVTMDIIKTEVMAILKKYEPRINTQNVIFNDAPNNDVIEIQVEWKLSDEIDNTLYTTIIEVGK